jgi:hypothetical protein
MVAPSADAVGAGAGLEGGFWAGLCAKTGESGPPAKRPAKTIANRDRAHSEAVLRVFTPKMDRFKVPLSVFIVIFTLEILSHWDVFNLT